MVISHIFNLPTRARRVGLLASLALMGGGFALWGPLSTAQVAGGSAQGVATLTVLAKGTGKDAQGNTVTGYATNDSGYVSGQSLQWVGTYQQLALSSIAKQQHVLSLGADASNPLAQAYVKGSTQAPPKFSTEWNVGTGTATSWTSTEPADGTAIKGVRYSYDPAIPKPLDGTVNFAGTGDGYRVIPYSIKINGQDVQALFIVNHHSGDGFIKCKVATTSADCPGWTAKGLSVPLADGAAFVEGIATYGKGTPTEESVWTANLGAEYLDRQAGKIYFPVGLVPATWDLKLRRVGILCADLVNKKSCGFTQTGHAANGPSHVMIAGLGTTASGRLLFFQDAAMDQAVKDKPSTVKGVDGRSRIHCFNVNTRQACTGQPYVHNAHDTVPDGAWTGKNMQVWNTSAFTYGERTFMTYYVPTVDPKDPNRLYGGSSYLSCFDNVTNTACSGFTARKLPASDPEFLPDAPGVAPVIVNGVRKTPLMFDSHTPMPLLNNKLELDGVCLTGFIYGKDGKVQPNCYYLDGKVRPLTAGTDLAKWLELQGWGGTARQVYVTKSGKAYNYDDYRRIVCYDFVKNSVGGLCFDRDAAHKGEVDITYPAGTPDIAAFYAITDDPERSGCVWILGHASVGVVWDELTGKACVQRVVTHRIPTKPADYYGFDGTVNGDISYQKVVFRNLGSSFVDPSEATGVRASVFEMNEDGSQGATLVDNQRLTQPTLGGDYVLDLTQFKDLTYKKYPRLWTVVNVYRSFDNNPWPDGVQGDVIWSGPPVQFSVQTKAPVSTTSCLAHGLVQQGVFTANSTLGTSTATATARSNALTENVAPVSNGPVMLESSALGYTRASPKEGEGIPTVAIFPSFNTNLFTGNIGFFDVTSGTPGAADPTRTKLADVHGLVGLSAANRKVHTVVADGTTVPFQWDQLDDGYKDALNRNRSGILDNIGQDRVAYLRGDRSKEIGRIGSNAIFHARADRGSTGFASTSTDIPAPGAMTSTGVALMLTGVLSGYSEALAPGYARFQKEGRHATTGRKLPVVFASSNDGFLYGHTVTAGSGKLALQEAFTYLPRRPMTLMSGYTDRGFSQLGAFPYLNDGSPLLADVCMKDCGDAAKAAWRTALVSSFGRAFAGGYALDVTDVTKTAAASAPVKSLWEFTDKTPVTTAAAQPDPARYLGKQSALPLSSFSNASLSTQVVRVKVDGNLRWAWIIGNGYGSPASDAAGVNSDDATAVLYVVLMDSATGGHPQYVGIRLPAAAGAPNGLSTPNPVDVNGDGTADLVYAGDLQGNLWRVDLSGLSLATGFTEKAAQVVMQARNGAVTGGAIQPIVGAPAVVPIGNTRRMVVFSSGRPEITDARYLDNAGALYSLIGVEDRYAPGSASSTTTPATVAPARNSCAVRTLGRTSTVAVKIKTGPTTSVEKSSTVRSVEGGAMDGKTCWALDLQSGESGIGNAAYNPVGQVVDLLSVESPATSSSCKAEPGKSWINRLNALTGKPVGFDINGNGAIDGAESSYGALNVGRATGIHINNGKRTSVGGAGGKSDGAGTQILPGGGVGRVWWREL